MSELTNRMMRLDPESDEFKRLLLRVAEDSDHPNDVAIARILRRKLEGLENLKRDRAELLAMPCQTLGEALAVASKMRVMIARYGQEAMIARYGQEACVGHNSDGNESARGLDITEEAARVWEAWNGSPVSLPNAMMRLRIALESAGISISKPKPDLSNHVEAWDVGRKFVKVRELREESGDSDGA